jgi:hypothetical protein
MILYLFCLFKPWEESIGGYCWVFLFYLWGVDQGFWGLKEEWTHPKIFVGSTPFSGWGTKPIFILYPQSFHRLSCLS